jgi:hypothetical protein
MILKSTIVAGNSVQRGHGPDGYGTITTAGHNLFQDGDGFVLTGDGTEDIFTPTPMLGPLQDNGGPTPTHALLPGSPAIDHGYAGDQTFDQRGVGLPIDVLEIPNAGDGSDIGAYEWIPESFRRLQAVVTPGSTAGTLIVRIVLESRGDENAIQVELNLPPGAVLVRDAVPGSDAGDATLTYGIDPNYPGRLSSTVTLSEGRAFEAGTHELAVFELESDSELAQASGGDLEFVAASVLSVDGGSLPVGVSVNVAPAMPVPHLSVSRNSAGDILIRLTGGEGYDWEIQGSRDFVNWRNVAMVENATSSAEVIDPSARIQPYSFYRVIASSNGPF